MCTMYTLRPLPREIRRKLQIKRESNHTRKIFEDCRRKDCLMDDMHQDWVKMRKTNLDLERV
jgi:hypothetical protein